MVFDAVDYDDHEEVVFVRDQGCGLRAIIAVHSTVSGAALGGCRILPYADDASALHDVLRLSRGMTYKAAMASIPFGGGKMVVIAEPAKDKTASLLQAIGRAIDRLGGKYFTGEDVGTTAEDMAVIRKTTANVMGLPESLGGSGDPSASTALGCFVGIQASVTHAFGRSSLDGLRVAVQGLGNVGFNLCRLLAQAGAKLTVTDLREPLIAKCVARFGARAVDPDAIYAADTEVLAPCALGAVLNEGTLQVLKARIIAGGANNQLAAPEIDFDLRQRGILYAPDFVINGGGLIQLAGELTRDDKAEVERRIHAIHDTLSSLYHEADADGLPTSQVAERIARHRVASGLLLASSAT
jgi:leucine dehydrogenase